MKAAELGVDLIGVFHSHSVAKEPLAKIPQLRETQVIVLAQTVGFPKK